jgi:YVTN family beta-propeller protein
MGGKNYKALIVIVFSALLQSCVKDKPPAINLPAHADSGNVYIVCEGNYGNGDATLYVYQPQKDSVYGDLYNAMNHQPLGDVFQSMTAIGNNLYLCINNSDKIVVLDKSTWQQQATINVARPRYVLPVSNTKAYVSTLFSNRVYVINPATNQVTDTLHLPAQNPEGMLFSNGYAYVCTWDTADNHIYKIDPATNAIAQTITIGGYAAQEIAVDREGMLWVLSGDQPEGKPAALTRIDPATGEILKTLPFTANADPVRLVFNNTKDTLYFIEADYNGGTANNGVYRMAINSNAIPTQPFIAAQANQYFWALGISPANGNIFVGDPKGFVQKGVVNIYQANGTLIKQFKTGLGPGHFYFDE